MILTELQALPLWAQPGNVGDDGGGNPRPHGKYSLEPGREMLATIQPGYGYDNFYFLARLGPFSWARLFRYDFELYMSSDALSKSQAFEFEIQQNVGGFAYNMAWQRRYDGVWSTFDFNAKLWDESKVDDPLKADGWTQISVEFLRTENPRAGKYLTHQSFATFEPVNITRPATAENLPDYLNIAFQMDSNAKADPYQIKLREMSLTLL